MFLEKYLLHIEEQLEHASFTHPFEQLGKHIDGDKTRIQVWLPDATSVSVYDLTTDQKIGDLTLSGENGLFSGAFSSLPDDLVYRLLVTNDDCERSIIDPYQFKEAAYHAVHYVDHQPQNVYRQIGAHYLSLDAGLSSDVKGTRFAVYAPNASAVSLIGDMNMWDARYHPMEKTSMGYWVLFVPDVLPGVKYKFRIKDQYGQTLPDKADPVGFQAEQYPSHASVVFDHSQYQWQDQAWQAYIRGDKYQQAMSIYEVHLGSWKKKIEDGAWKSFNYRELVEELLPYVKSMNYTHIELLPISEHPFDGSWGYQPVGLFAPTSRFGNPDDFKYFVDQCHQQGIGVIIDWVPAHFPEDGHGLARFDGTHVYEYDDPKKGWHPDWHSCIYDFGKDTVRQFLVANALFWLEHFHVDGLRVDAVASMLYLDYSREDGEWIPNVDGGNHNYEAISLLQWMNKEVYAHFPHAITIAEESTSFPKVSHPVHDGGLGFGFKWNMGWMNDSLHYISKDPSYRRYHHNEITFSTVYAWDESFILPISHDEVVHGKGSMIRKMPGDEWQQAANLRCYAGFMYAHPGKKLNFMGNELGQANEWNHDGSLTWDLLEFEKHRGIQSTYRDLNKLYTATPALYEQDHVAAGFEWIDHADAERSMLIFVRKASSSKQRVYCVCNFTPLPRADFKLGVLDGGGYSLIFNSDSQHYWGSNQVTGEEFKASQSPNHGKPFSITIQVPPLSTLYILYDA